MAKRIELTVGIAPASYVLYNDVVTMPRKPDGMCVDHRRSDIAPVRLAHQKGGMRPGIAGVVVVRNKLDAIGHAAADTAFRAYSAATIHQMACPHAFCGSE